jgi:hypothetical protein
MICENGLPISSPVFNISSNLALNSSWAFSVSALASASFGATLTQSVGGIPAVPFERVAAREDISAVVSDGDLQRVRLPGVDEVFLRLELDVGTKASA